MHQLISIPTPRRAKGRPPGRRAAAAIVEADRLPLAPRSRNQPQGPSEMAGRAANDEVDMGEIKNVVIDDYSKGKASSTRGGTTLRPIAPTSASVGPVVHVLLGLITVVVLVCLGLGAAIYVEVKDSNGDADCDGLANQVSALQDKVSQTEASCTAAFTSEVYTFEVHKQKFPSCLRPPGYPNHAWTDILAEAEGSTVNFYSWDGSNQTNSWIDYWLKPRVADYFNINLVRVGIDDTAKAVDIVRTEVNQNNAAGSVGLIWINGDNFAVMKNENLLYGPWADRAPNSVRCCNAILGAISSARHLFGSAFVWS
eukprot:6173775-Pleurochrysis_carterae.AAC.1